MERPITLEQLHRNLSILIENGYGKKEVYLLTDEEGNDYRPLYEGQLAFDKNLVKNLMQVSCSGLSICRNPENAIIIG